MQQRRRGTTNGTVLGRKTYSAIYKPLSLLWKSWRMKTLGDPVKRRKTQNIRRLSSRGFARFPQ
jgi:hypothetical protein